MWLDGQIVKVNAIDSISFLEGNQGVVGIFFVDATVKAVVKDQLPTTDIETCGSGNLNKLIDIGSLVVVMKLIDPRPLDEIGL